MAGQGDAGQGASTLAGGVDGRRGAGGAEAVAGNPLADRQPVVWRRSAADGSGAAAREGRGIHAARDHRARGQGRQGPGDDVARIGDRTAPAPADQGEGVA